MAVAIMRTTKPVSTPATTSWPASELSDRRPTAPGTSRITPGMSMIEAGRFLKRANALEVTPMVSAPRNPPSSAPSAAVE